MNQNHRIAQIQKDLHHTTLTLTTHPKSCPQVPHPNGFYEYNEKFQTPKKVKIKTATVVKHYILYQDCLIIMWKLLSPLLSIKRTPTFVVLELFKQNKSQDCYIWQCCLPTCLNPLSLCDTILSTSQVPTWNCGVQKLVQSTGWTGALTAWSLLPSFCSSSCPKE